MLARQPIITIQRNWDRKMSACEQMDAWFEQYNTTVHATHAFVRLLSWIMMRPFVETEHIWAFVKQITQHDSLLSTDAWNWTLLLQTWALRSWIFLPVDVNSKIFPSPTSSVPPAANDQTDLLVRLQMVTHCLSPTSCCRRWTRTLFTMTVLLLNLLFWKLSTVPSLTFHLISVVSTPPRVLVAPSRHDPYKRPRRGASKCRTRAQCTTQTVPHPTCSNWEVPHVL